ncbi:sigma-70 family RNA polymerase sigma factor [Fulvivirga sp.]|jgi:RNA polymerase sigma factor (sigma-70 family)|uniref:RNA polymerase sigma factor n=1 Tax=Fulvivirga sp. TaxID=1931237 RepID=UPI0032ED6A04
MMVLIEGCKNGDRESQRLLYKHYYSFALAICIRYSQSMEEAKEILNDGFYKVFSKIELYDIDRSFEGWVKRIMINTAIDHYRANKKHYNHDDIIEHDKAVGENVMDDMSYEELLLLIQKLSPAYRTVFSLYVIDNYTHPKIAKKLGITVSTSKSNLMKARANLKKMLKVTNREVYEQYIR